MSDFENTKKLPLDDIRNRKVISVCCASSPTPHEEKLAYEVGQEIARRGAILVCGGLQGSMEAVCKGTKENGGLTIGIIPFYEKETANDWVDIVIPTGMGHARNLLVVATGDGVIGVGGSWGTLNELSIAVKLGKPVAVINGWTVSNTRKEENNMIQVDSAELAVSVALGESPRISSVF